MAQCSDCGRQFSTTKALHAHCRDRADHFFCENCQRFFVNSQALRQHFIYSPVHQRDTSSDEYEEEYEDDDEDEEEAFCEPCDREFVDNLSLYRHLAASSRHNGCFVCSRDFSSAQALEQHSSSRVHKACDLKCPLCPKTFKFPSAIALHIESGACHNISRRDVTRAVHSLKVAPTISISRRLEGPTSSTSDTIIHYSATAQAWNGTGYECYLCHRAFRTLVSLNTHINSPAHDTDQFKCPKCKRTYKLISGLIQHIETEVCGLARFQQVEDHTTALTSQFARLLTF